MSDYGPFIPRADIPSDYQDLFDYRSPFFAYGQHDGFENYARGFDGSDFPDDLNVQAARALRRLPVERHRSFVGVLEQIGKRQGWKVAASAARKAYA